MLGDKFVDIDVTHKPLRYQQDTITPERPKVVIVKEEPSSMPLPRLLTLESCIEHFNYLFETTENKKEQVFYYQMRNWLKEYLAIRPKKEKLDFILEEVEINEQD